jgi:ethanolamine utilization cobalamin adenosyltransferase
MVIPNSERNVLSLLTKIELRANKNPSLRSLKNILLFFKNIILRVKDTKIIEVFTTCLTEIFIIK